MEKVFSLAYCTIAATSAVNSKAGFLERNVSTEYVLVQDALGRQFYICTGMDDSITMWRRLGLIREHG